MRIKKLMNEASSAASQARAGRNEWLAGFDDEKKDQAGIIQKIKDALKKLNSPSFKMRVDDPGGLGGDDSDFGNVKVPGPDEDNVQKTANMSWSPQDAADLYKGAKKNKPYFAKRVWNPLEDTVDFLKHVKEKIASMLGMGVNDIKDADLVKAFESLDNKDNINALYESYLATRVGKGQTIKLKDLLED